jgi:hypothetical protein
LAVISGEPRHISTGFSFCSTRMRFSQYVGLND